SDVGRERVFVCVIATCVRNSNRRPLAPSGSGGKIVSIFAVASWLLTCPPTALTSTARVYMCVLVAAYLHA
ncbi:hypothetical protein BaRGS_00003316, partial [Batillaria attramentaria]